MLLIERLTRLEGALVAASPSDGGPARRIAADYGAKGKKSKSSGGGRKVASKAGEKRYGLPIGTPLGQTKARTKDDAATQKAYDTFMSANTPADLRKAAGWMSNDDLSRAADGVFSIDNPNERDQAATIALVKELADRGIDPHTLGYKGGPVVLNPNPKKDPVARAAETVQKANERAAAKAQREQDKATRTAKTAADKKERESAAANAKANREAEKATRDAAKAKKDAEDAVEKAAKDKTTKAIQDARQALAQAIVEGAITEADARREMAGLRR